MTRKIIEMNKMSDRLMQENESMKRELQKVGYFLNQKGLPDSMSNQHSYIQTTPIN